MIDQPKNFGAGLKSVCLIAEIIGILIILASMFIFLGGSTVWTIGGIILFAAGIFSFLAASKVRQGELNCVLFFRVSFLLFHSSVFILLISLTKDDLRGMMSLFGAILIVAIVIYWGVETYIREQLDN